jgi:hypothetical protein
MQEGKDMKLAIIVALVISISFVVFIGVGASKHEATAKDLCNAKGGTLILTRGADVCVSNSAILTP